MGIVEYDGRVIRLGEERRKSEPRRAGEDPQPEEDDRVPRLHRRGNQQNHGKNGDRRGQRIHPRSEHRGCEQRDDRGREHHNRVPPNRKEAEDQKTPSAAVVLLLEVSGEVANDLASRRDHMGQVSDRGNGGRGPDHSPTSPPPRPEQGDARIELDHGGEPDQHAGRGVPALAQREERADEQQQAETVDVPVAGELEHR